MAAVAISPRQRAGDLRALVVGKRDQSNIENGRPISLVESDRTLRSNERFRAYSLDGEFLAIIRFDSMDDCWRPDKVFRSSNDEWASDSG